jgi:hypothetical protein
VSRPQSLGVRVALAVGLALVLAAVASAQDGFRVTHTVDRGNPGQTRINGTVFNDNRLDAVDVYVTAEAVDASGKAIARGIAFVSPSIRAGSSAPFSATVPTMAGTTAYRARVSSFRFGPSLQSP